MTQSARPGGTIPQRVDAPQPRRYFSGRGQAFDGFAGNESPPMGRAGGGWTPNQGGAAGAGRAMAPSRPAGAARGWGGRAGGSAMR